MYYRYNQPKHITVIAFFVAVIGAIFEFEYLAHQLLVYEKENKYR